jgi:ribonuclease HI
MEGFRVHCYDCYVCFFDGSCEPINPGGDIGIGAVIYRVKNFKISGNFKETKLHKDSKEEVFSISKRFSRSEFIKSTNNIAEHLACYECLLWLKENNIKEPVFILGDSQLVVNQLEGTWNINEDKPYTEYAKRNQEILSTLGKKISLKWIPRHINTTADELSTSGMKVTKYR